MLMTWRSISSTYTKLDPGNGVIPIVIWEHLDLKSQPDGLRGYCYLSTHEDTKEICYRLRLTKLVDGKEVVTGDCHLPWAMISSFRSFPHPDDIS